MLGVSHDTITRWCASGKLFAHSVPYGNKASFRIPLAAVLMLKQQRETLPAMAGKKPGKEKQQEAPSNHTGHLGGFIKALQRGTLWGRPLSPKTIESYQANVRRYLTRFPVLTGQGVRDYLNTIPPHQHATKEHAYRGLVAFGKYLIDQTTLSSGFLQEVASYRPKKNPQPQRVRVSPDSMAALLGFASPFEAHLIKLITNTGLRSAEACGLNVEDIDLKKQTLLVRRGKGNKSRLLGLNAEALSSLVYLMEERTTGPILINRKGERMTPDGIYQRIARLGGLAGVRVTVHSLRRYFITSNASQGRPITFIQRAAGHSNITTTRLYVLETEQEVIRAMQAWAV